MVLLAIHFVNRDFRQLDQIRELICLIVDLRFHAFIGIVDSNKEKNVFDTKNSNQIVQSLPHISPAKFVI